MKFNYSEFEIFIILKKAKFKYKSIILYINYYLLY